MFFCAWNVRRKPFRVRPKHQKFCIFRRVHGRRILCFGTCYFLRAGCKSRLQIYGQESEISKFFFSPNWDPALTGALQSPNTDNSWKGTHGVLNSRMHCNLFGSSTESWSKGAFDNRWKGTNKGNREFVLFIKVI